MRRHKRGIALIVTGVLLLLFASGWIFYNEMDNRRAGARADYILVELKQQAVQPTGDTVLVGDEPFCGRIMIEKLGLELPVFDQWSMTHLAEAPCRYAGSVAEGGLVIAAHNYRNHFGKLHQLQEGDTVLLIDNSGKEYRYIVREKSTLDGTAVEDMVSGNWELTLFTCTKGGKQRVTVRCENDG